MQNFTYMIHPDTELKFINNEVGYGIVATKFIPKGTITWVMDKLDREFSPLQVEQMDELYKNILMKYTFRNNIGNFILCWDNARYVNHSFNSNCLTTAYDFEIAIRDIEAGEELTDDYGYLNITEPFYAIPENGSDRNTVYPDDLLKFHKIWDQKLEIAFKNLAFIGQPLQSILRKEIWDKACNISKGAEKMDSILNCYYSGQ